MELENISQSIDEKYKDLKHTLGWRFINSSKNTIQNNSGICMVTLNPSGDIFEESICALDDSKNAYLDENWENRGVGKDKLQIQIQYMFNEIHQRTNTYENHKELMRNSFMAHFIPFRSPTFDLLHNQKLSVDFSKKLWKQIFKSPSFNFSTIICIGREQFEVLEELLMNSYSFNNSKEIKTGWGNYKSVINEYSNNRKKVKLVYLQHLSRFSIFNRKENKGKEEIKILFDYIMK